MGESSDSEPNDSEEIDTPKSSAPGGNQKSENDDSQSGSKSKSSSPRNSHELSSDENSGVNGSSTRKRVSKKKKRAVVSSDSDSDEEPAAVNKSKGRKGSDDKQNSNKESSSDDSQSRDVLKPATTINTETSDDDSQMNSKSTSPESRKKKCVIVMSDSDSEEPVITNATESTRHSDDDKDSSDKECDLSKKKQATATLDSDSEDSNAVSNAKGAKRSEDDEEKNSEDEMNDDEIVNKKNEMFQKFHGSDSSDEGPFIHEERGEDSSLGKKEKKKERKKRLKPVEDEKLKIYSETQRMIREKEISLPYHKPKQRSLREFLSRRKPTVTNVPLSSSYKKMKEVWKEIEESTQSVSEFFKSESEGEEEENEKSKGDDEKMEKELEFKSKELCSNVKISDESQSRMEEEAAKDFKEEMQISKVVRDLRADLMEVEANEIADEKMDSGVDSKIMSAVDDTINSTVDAVKEVTLNEDEGFSESTNVENSKLETGESISNMPTKTVVDLKEKLDTNSNSTDSKKDPNNWMKNVLEYEKNENPKQKLIKRIDPKLLAFTPKLSGDPDSFIDLTDKSDNLENGAKKLLDRFVKNCIIPKKHCIKKEFELTVAAGERNEKGEICNVVSEKLMYRITEDIIIEDTESEKPGAKLQRLREELQLKMAEKWEVEYKKKVAEEKENEVAKKKEEELEEEWEEEEIEESEEGESEPEENDIEIVDKKKKKSKYVDSEAEESGEEGGDELEDDEDETEDKEEEEEIEKTEENRDKRDEDDEEMESLIPAYQPGGGFLHGGSTLTQSARKNNLDGLLSPSYTLSGMTTKSPYSKDLSPSTQTSQATNNFTCPDSVDSHRRKLFTDSTSTGNERYDLDDAFDFCSGRFPGATQKDSEESQSIGKVNGVSQLVNEESQEYNVDDLISGKFGTQKKYFSSIDNELCEGWFETQGKTQEAQEVSKPIKRRITILDDDDDSNLETPSGLDSITEPEICTSKRIASDDENDNAMDGLLIFNKKNKKHLKFSDDEDEDNKEDEEEEVDQENDLEKEADEESEVENEEAPEGEIDYDSEENEIIRPTDFIEKEAELSESEWSGDEDEKGLDFLDMEAGDDDKLDNDQVRSQLEKIHMRRVLDDDKREVRLLQELFFEDGDLHSDGKGRDRKFRWKNIGTFENDENRPNESGEENSDDEAAAEEERQRLKSHERTVFLMEAKKKGEIKSDDENDDDENSILKIGLSLLGKCTKNVVTVNNKPEGEEINVKGPLAPVIKRGSFLNRNEQYLSRLAKLTGTHNNINGPKNSNNFVFKIKSPEKEKVPVEGNKRKIQDCNEVARKKKKSENGAHVTFGPSLLDQLA